jgi:hypothetical protein
LGQYEETKVGPNGQLKRKKYRLRNHMTLEMEQFRRRRYNWRYHMTFEEGVRKKRTKGN